MTHSEQKLLRHVITAGSPILSWLCSLFLPFDERKINVYNVCWLYIKPGCLTAHYLFSNWNDLLTSLLQTAEVYRAWANMETGCHKETCNHRWTVLCPAVGTEKDKSSWASTSLKHTQDVPIRLCSVFSGCCTHLVSLSRFSPGLIYRVHRDTQRYRQRLIGLRCTLLSRWARPITQSKMQQPHKHSNALFILTLRSDRVSQSG